MMSLRYNDLFSPIIRAIQELSQKSDEDKKTIEDLRKENQILKDQYSDIVTRLEKLEKSIK
jgi:hypothetical protein